MKKILLTLFLSLVLVSCGKSEQTNIKEEGPQAEVSTGQEVGTAGMPSETNGERQ